MDIDEKRLCSDWLAEFPLLKRHQGGRKLLRVLIVLVVFRDRVAQDLLEVVPTGVHRDEPPLEMEELQCEHGDTTKKSLQYHIEYDEHAQQYGEAARIMRVCFPILSSEEVTEQMIVDLYRQECERAKAGHPLDIWASLVEILKYYGRAEGVC